MADPESALDFIWIRIYENSHNADPDADSLPIVSVMIRNLYLKKNPKIIILKAKRNCYKYIRLDHRCSVLLGKVFVIHTGIHFDAFVPGSGTVPHPQGRSGSKRPLTGQIRPDADPYTGCNQN